MVQVALETLVQENTSQGTKTSTLGIKQHHSIATDRPRCRVGNLICDMRTRHKHDMRIWVRVGFNRVWVINGSTRL
jgi:hypothetical protein